MPHIECVKNNGKPYLRFAESRYVKDIGRQKKFVLKNLGSLSKFDDGKPDFLKRFREKLKKHKETLGFYSIVTSEIDEEDKEIINRYHGLSRIEDSFRIIKSDLEGRPIYVWTEEHIKAYFLICFMASTIIRIIQYKILKHENKSTLNVDG